MNILATNCSELQVNSIQFEPYTSGQITSIKVIATINCCSNIFEGTFHQEDIIDETITIPQTFFGRGSADSLMSGIYSIKFIINTLVDEVVGVITDENCAFIDCSFTCNFKEIIDKLLSTEISSDKQEALESAMLHYTLINSSNCGCNCSQLCMLYSQLYKLTYGDTLNLSDNIKNSDCGC